jgi:Ca2+-dependent lipid-binding protein
VVIKKGESLIGETSIIYKTLSPSWSDSFVYPMNDVNGSILFQILDYDEDDDDDEMGEVLLHLSEIPDLGVYLTFDKPLSKVKRGRLSFEICIEVAYTRLITYS